MSPLAMLIASSLLALGQSAPLLAIPTFKQDSKCIKTEEFNVKTSITIGRKVDNST